MTTENNKNSEWDFVKSVVDANNKGDNEAVFKFIQEFNFIGKYQAISVVICAISLVKNDVLDNWDVLVKFVADYEHEFESERIGFRERVRLAFLQEMLLEIKETNAKGDV